MVAVGMSPEPLKVIGRKVCLCARSPFRLLKDLEGLVMDKRQVMPRTCAIRGGMWPLAIWEQS